VIAVHLSGSDHRQTQANVLGQIGVLASVCSDNLVLYEAAARAIVATVSTSPVKATQARNSALKES